MPILTIAHLGDVVGRPGREAASIAIPALRRDHSADLVIINGENARHGRGLHPVGLQELLDAGADAITLGDHYYDDPRILDALADPHRPVAKPVNAPQAAEAMTWTKLAGAVSEPVYVVTALGRLFMPLEPDEPFAALDATIERITEADPDALVIVEIHAEATSEKAATAWHCAWHWPGTVMAVHGSHTHVQTNDARLLENRLSAITDLGMTGGHTGVIGFDAQCSVERIVEKRPSKLVPCEFGLQADGVLVRIDTTLRRAVNVRTIQIDCGAASHTPTQATAR